MYLERYMTARKRAKEGYTLAEMRVLTDRMIDDSVERLRKSLRAAWKKRVDTAQNRLV